ALLMDEPDLAILFSANRAYFLVDMEVPADYVNFLQAMLADKTAAELYTMIGLQKAGKNLFYRDFLHHLKHSRDQFIVAPVIKHLYIERRVTPLNLFLERADDAQRAHAMREYGTALKELAAVNIFAGDLLFKNFGVTRFGRVVFYDYDEIEYLADCNFRRIPSPPPGWDDMSGDVWYGVGKHDIFPEEFATFLLTDARIRECFLAAHAELL